jgi:threonine aldolase
VSINEADAITVDLDSVQTNLVYFTTPNADQLADACLADGVSMLAVDPTTIRAVFHLDISPQDATNAAEIVKGLSLSSAQS